VSVGLDLGTTEFRSIRNSSDDLVARRCRASYLVVKDTPGHRRLVEHAQARHGVCGDDLVVFGDDALECGEMLDLPVIPLLRDGRLPSADPVARQILALMVEAVLPAAEQNGTACCLTVPGGYGLEGDAQSLDVRLLKQLVALRGYTPQLISSGLAVVLAELSCASFSGLGISLGATNCEVAVIHCGRELARCTVPGRLGELHEAFPHVQNSSADQSPDGLGESLRAVWERSLLRVLAAILSEARESLESEGSIRMIQQPVSVACTGGITVSENFPSLFQQAWNQAGWPVRVAQTRLSANPHFAIARGCLIKAIFEGQPAANRRVA
jgi:hypothetical protein